MKRDVIIIGATVMFMFYTVLLATFMLAYESETKQVVVDINAYGEAKIEYIMLMFTTPLLVLAYYYIIEELSCRRCRLKKS